MVSTLEFGGDCVSSGFWKFFFCRTNLIHRQPWSLFLVLSKCDCSVTVTGVPIIETFVAGLKEGLESYPSARYKWGWKPTVALGNSCRVECDSYALWIGTLEKILSSCIDCSKNPYHQRCHHPSLEFHQGFLGSEYTKVSCNVQSSNHRPSLLSTVCNFGRIVFAFPVPDV